MSKRRDWDRVRAEDKVRRKGSLPVTTADWQPEHHAPAAEGTAHREDKKKISEITLERYEYHCGGYFISVGDDLSRFAQNNRLKAADPRTELIFADVKRRFERDFKMLLSHAGLVATSEDVHREIRALEKLRGRRLSFTL